MKNKILLLSLGLTFSHFAFSQCNNSGIGTLLPNAKFEIRGCGTTSVTAAFKVTNSTDTTTTPILFLRNDKRVGIGLDNPSQALEVAGTIFSNTGGFKFPDGTTQTSAAQISNGSLTVDKIITTRITSFLGDSLIKFGDSTVVINYNQARIFNDQTSSIKGLAIGNLSLAVAPNSTALGYKVRVVGNNAAVNAITIGSGTSTAFLNNTTPNSLKLGFNSDIPTLFVAPANGNGTTGIVCIGTTQIPDASNPNRKYKLAVAGTIIATEVEVKLQNAWPDFVFTKNYKLLSVGDLEKYVIQFGHLPDMPSAEEVKQKEGINVGEMQQKLLQKIEELTLYTIEQNKRIEILEKQLIEQK